LDKLISQYSPAKRNDHILADQVHREIGAKHHFCIVTGRYPASFTVATSCLTPVAVGSYSTVARDVATGRVAALELPRASGLVMTGIASM